jgi:PAS domain S-box-containing protein
MTTMGSLSTQAEQVEEVGAHFFEHSLDLLCVAGLDGYFKRVNPAWTNRLGWTVQELTAAPFLDFVHPDDRTASTTEIARLAAGAPTILFENRYRHQDGSYLWLQWNARLAPEHRLIYATARDVSRQNWLEREILEIADREKERLGRELHDGLCQSLAGVAALSVTLSRRLAASAESAASAAAAEIAQLLNEIIGQARDLARGLGPVGLSEGGLAGALATLAVNVEHLFEISCTLDCDSPFGGLPCEVKLHLFRIAQEAVQNAVTHGRADRIEIGLSGTDKTGVLSVRDNGVGIPEGARNVDGIGLHTMAYRSHLIGGSLEVRRRTPQGTAVICAFPLAAIPDPADRPHDVHTDT